jgi:hypothetical protein
MEPKVESTRSGVFFLLVRCRRGGIGVSEDGCMGDLLTAEILEMFRSTDSVGTMSIASVRLHVGEATKSSTETDEAATE